MDRNSVGGVGHRARALGRSGAWMSEAGAVLLIFGILAVALTAIRPRRRSERSTHNWAGRRKERKFGTTLRQP